MLETVSYYENKRNLPPLLFLKQRHLFYQPLHFHAKDLTSAPFLKISKGHFHKQLRSGDSNQSCL